MNEELWKELYGHRRRIEALESAPKSPKYLPCPFCGDKDINLIATSLQDYSKYECWCHSCGISGPDSRDKYRAIASWNRRV